MKCHHLHPPGTIIHLPTYIHSNKLTIICCSPFISSPPPPPLSHSLRLQLEKVRALRDQYETGYRTSEALERLMKLSKRTRDCDREYRANERALAAIEAQLEAMIGTFRIRVEELEGFARICPRDSYEIEFRHGKQRRVLRVRIGKARKLHHHLHECELEDSYLYNQ